MSDDTQLYEFHNGNVEIDDETKLASSYFYLYRKRRRRRFLRVPETEEDLRTMVDVYCDPNDQGDGEKPRFYPGFVDNESQSVRNTCRALPSIDVLASVTDEISIKGKSSRKSSPETSLLMQNFYKSIGMNEAPSETPENDSTADNIGDDEKQVRQVMEEINDPSRSTLKKGHHRRYLQLTKSKDIQTSKRTFAERKEFAKLHQMVSKEQALYQVSLDKFHDDNKSRYLEGFQHDSSNSKAFSRWACSQAQAINKEWGKAIATQIGNVKPLPKCYGKAWQTLALHSGTYQDSLDVQDLTCSVVHESLQTPQLSLSSKIPEFSVENIQNNTVLKSIPCPTMDSTPAVHLLRNDSKAIEFAVKHSAAIVTTSDTLETLLKLPGDYSSSWVLPCTTKLVPIPKTGTASTSKSSMSITILDIPIAQAYSSPRSCLEAGLQEGLYQGFIKHYKPPEAMETSGETDDGNGERDKHYSPATQFVYSLWTLPTKTGPRKPIRVIIRTLVRLRDSVSKLPVRLRAHVEYFPSPVDPNDSPMEGSRPRLEILNSYEKSLWILDQVLFGHKVFCLQYRINPMTCKVLSWEAVSIAHAFAASATDSVSGEPKSNHKDTGPLNNWKALIRLLLSVSSIDMPDTLLRLPGLIDGASTNRTDSDVRTQHTRMDPFSVSVHPPSSASTGIVELNKMVLDQAGSVILGDHALRDCRREWEWDRPGQVPNTYPVPDTNPGE